MKISKETKEQRKERLDSALWRHTSGVITNMKTAQDAARTDQYTEMLLWLTNAQHCLKEVIGLATLLSQLESSHKVKDFK